jgi:hypothetical protein
MEIRVNKFLLRVSRVQRLSGFSKSKLILKIRSLNIQQDFLDEDWVQRKVFNVQGKATQKDTMCMPQAGSEHAVLMMERFKTVQARK